MSLFLLALIGSIIYAVVGFVWHGPIFGRAWGKALGMKESDMVMDTAAKRGMYIRIAIGLVANYIMSFVLFFLALNFRVVTLGQAALFFAIIFVGFIVPHQISTNLWNGRPTKDALKLFSISFGYQLIMFIILSLLYWIV